METFLYVFLIIFLAFLTGFIRYKLTKWEKIVERYGVESLPDSEPIYGLWSEFKFSPRSYPLANSFLKVIPIANGLYLQYDLKYEPIKFYKPVLIPWHSLKFYNSGSSTKKGCDEIHIENNGYAFGLIYIQCAMTDLIIKRAASIGVDLNLNQQ